MTAASTREDRRLNTLPGANKVLVTGATGFVGRRLVRRLRSWGTQVVEVAPSLGHDMASDRLPLDGVEHVFHAGACTGVPAAWEDPVRFLEANTLGTARVLDQCRRAGCSLTFFSAYIYGQPKKVPIRETDPADVNNPYALSKYLAEQACVFFARAYGQKVVILRLFNLYGPGQSNKFLIPFVVDQVLDTNVKTVEVLDLAPQRDYIYVEDAIDAIVQTTQVGSGSIFNVGSGTAHSVEEIIRCVCEVSRVHKPFRGKAQRRPNEIDITVADTSAITNAVGWVPRTTLEAGIGRILEDRAA